MATYNLEIYDEGQSVGFWKTVGLNAPTNPADNLIRVKNVADMVTKVLMATQRQTQKINIYLKGVGTANYQSVGAGTTQDVLGYRSLQTDGNGELNQEGKKWLPHLIGKVNRIYLLGIEENGWSAGNKGSFPLLSAIANLLTGVHIHGNYGEGSGIVYFPNNHARPLTIRTSAERQQLRDSLKKLD